MKRRQVGFSFIEILVVMGIIAVLVSMVVFFVPRIQERTRQTKSTDNMKGMLQYMVEAGVGLSKPWPPYSAKNFTLWLVAANKIDRRDDKQLQVLFSPGDQHYTFEAVGVKAYEAITLDTLKAENPDLMKLTSYAGRRNKEKGHQLDSDELSRGAMVFCDDDDGPLHHKDGLVVGYSNGGAKFVEWAELGIPPPDTKDPAGTLGDNATNEDLKHMSSGN